MRIAPLLLELSPDGHDGHTTAPPEPAPPPSPPDPAKVKADLLAAEGNPAC